jgi:hypothetical protein
MKTYDITIQHTPTPWSVAGISNAAFGIKTARQMIISPAGVIIADCGMALHGNTIIGASTKEGCKANAAFIVRACNSHADFVAIIDKVSRYLTGDCRTGDLSELESIICDVEAIRAKHDLDKSATQ